MAPIPGTLKEDGSIDRTVGSSGYGTVLFRNAENPEACWKVIDWLTSDDIQYRYATELENILGVAGRYATANLNAFSNLPWSRAELIALDEQRQCIREVPEVPGGYLVSRCLDNAFRSVYLDNKNPREQLEKQNEAMNRELVRKRKELEARKQP